MRASVLMMAYNHERFIEEAVASVLCQQLDGPWEIVIGEDCSTDRTRDLLIGLQRRNPQRIRLLLSETNLGMNRNFVRTLKACQGTYVAILEGDDYWTDSRKLQRQVDFLDHHSECVICFHNVRVVFDDGRPEAVLQPSKSGCTSRIEDILRGNYIPTCSVLFRNRQVSTFPDWFFRLQMIDWPLHILNALQGDIGHLDETSAAYRVHAGGAFSTKNRVETLQASLELYLALRGQLDESLQAVVAQELVKTWYAMAVAHIEEGDREDAEKCAAQCWAVRPRSQALSYRLKLLIRLFAPGLFRTGQRIWGLRG